MLLMDEYILWDKGELNWSRNKPTYKPRKNILNRRVVLGVNHKKQSIDIINTKELAKRISIWHPNVRKALYDLITAEEQFLDYRLYTSARTEGPMKELAWSGNYTRTFSVRDFLYFDSLPRFFTHGTDYNSALDILENGLQTRAESGRRAVYGTHFAPSLDDRVYLFGDLGHAALAAFQVTTHGAKATNLKAAILAVKVPDERLLLPDEDAKYARNWEESLWTTGSVAYGGSIDPEYIQPLLQCKISGSHYNRGGNTITFWRPHPWEPFEVFISKHLRLNPQQTSLEFF